jgi:hypothetical protein
MNSKVIIAIVVITLMVGLASIASFLYGQNKALKSQVNPTPVVKTQATPSPTANASASPSPTPTISPVTEKPPVIYEGISASSSDKPQIQERIIDPIIDYFAEHPGQGIIASITISTNNNPSKITDPYTYMINLKNSAYESALISKSNGQISWWGPSCMVCTFSDSYKAKYPEVVKNY